MAVHDSLKSLVRQYIKTNGQNEITGQILQNVLIAMIDELGGENGYAGVATPSTNPGAPDGKVFYFATEAGTYTHFDGATLTKGIHLLVFNGVTWSHQTLYTIDSEVTSESNNLITSGAVYTKIINAINALDATVSKSAGADGLSLSLTEVDGKVTNISGSIAPQTYDAYGAASEAQSAASTDATNKVNAAKTQILGDAASDYNTLGKLEDKIQAEASRAAAAESALNTAKANKATTLAGYGINDAYTKTEVNGLVSTPHQNYVTVSTYASLPATGSADTIYRVSNYNGSTSQVDASVYSEYAWNGSGYTFLRVVSQIGEVFDITVYNSNTKYADLAAALGTNGANVPSSIRRGGMSVKFVQSSDNKYVQYRLMSDEWSTAVNDWQGVDEEPIAGSDNLIKSGGVELSDKTIQSENNGLHITFHTANTFIPFNFISGRTYKIKVLELTATVVTLTTRSSSSPSSSIIDRIDGCISQGTYSFTASADAYAIKAGDPCSILLYEEGSVYDKLLDSGILILSQIAENTVSSLLNAGEYGYSISNDQIVHKITQTRLETSTPSDNMLYKYNGRLYYYNGEILEIIANENDINATIVNERKNIKNFADIDESKDSVFIIESTIIRDVRNTLLDYLGDVNIEAKVETIPNIGYDISATNKDTGSYIRLGRVLDTDNTTGVNEIKYKSEGFNLVDLRITGHSTAPSGSGAKCKVTLIKDNLISNVIHYVNKDSITKSLQYASTSPVVAFDFRKGEKYLITNNGSNQATFTLVNFTTISTTGQVLYNRTDIPAGGTVEITAEANCSYLRCGSYDESPSVVITDITLHKEIEDDKLLAMVNEDKQSSYLAFGYDRGGLIYTDGTYARNRRRCLTGWLPYSNEDIVVRGASSADVNLISFFSADHSYLGGINGVYYNDKIIKISASDVPSNTAYIRVVGILDNDYYGQPSNRNFVNLAYKENFWYNKTKEFIGSYQFGRIANGRYNPGIVPSFEHQITDVAAWYSLYDSLVTRFPEYASKVDCDTEYANTQGAMQRPSELNDLPIYMYKFAPYYCPVSPNGDVVETESNKLKVFICTGTHPEYMAIWDCFKMMEAICTHWQDNDNLWDMRWNVEWYIMPVSGPWGCANASRVNYNGVDLNRNAPGTEWILYDYGTDSYSGPTAGSEYETKVWVYFLNKINPKVFIDHHNFGGNLSKNFMYGESKHQLVRDVMASHAVDITMLIKKEYGTFTGNYKQNPLVGGYVTSRETIGCTRDKYAHDAGIISGTFETNMRFNYENGGVSPDIKPAYDTNACSVATECFSNFIIKLLKEVAIQCIPNREN